MLGAAQQVAETSFHLLAVKSDDFVHRLTGGLPSQLIDHGARGGSGLLRFEFGSESNLLPDSATLSWASTRREGSAFVSGLKDNFVLFMPPSSSRKWDNLVTF